MGDTPATPDSESVSIVGLGLMGSALASIFIKRGWKTTIWNRSPAKAAGLTAKGATLASSAAECINSSSLTIVCVADFNASVNVFKDFKYSNPERKSIIVNFTTLSSSQAKESERIAESAGVSGYIQGAILTTPAFVGQPDSPLYYSGSQSAFDTVKGALEVLGKANYLGSDVESAVVYDAIVLSNFYGLTSGFLQSMAILRKSTLYRAGGMESFTQQALIPVMTEVVGSLAHIAKQMDEGQYKSDGVGATIGSQLNTLETLENTVREHGLSSLAFKPLMELMKVRIAQGGEDEEVAGLLEALVKRQ